MIEEILGNASAQPLKVVAWIDGDEIKPVLCVVCGWRGQLGACAKRDDNESRVYNCPMCEKALVIRTRLLVPNSGPASPFSPRRGGERPAPEGVEIHSHWREKAENF